MIRILTGVKVRHAACGAILRQITASKGSKGPMVALSLVRKTSGLLTCTHTLCFVSSGLPGSIGPAYGYAVTCSAGRHLAGTTEHGSGSA